MKAKRRIWLHIGMHKTGSSSIQRSFAGYRSDSLRYASLLVPNHSRAMELAFGSTFDDPVKQARMGWDGIGRDAMRDRVMALLRREFATPEPELVFSGEGLTSLTATEVAGLAAVLHAHAEDVQVLAYVRKPAGFMSSAFQQRVKGGLARFICPQARYRARFEGYLQVFGAQNVAFRSFDALAASGRSVVQDFAGWIGADPASVTEVRVNDSLSAAAVAVLYAGNQAIGGKKRSREADLCMKEIIDLVGQALPLAEHGKFRIDPEVVAARIDAADVRWIEAAAGFPVMGPRFDTTRAADVKGHDDLMAVAEAMQPRIAALVASQGVAVASTLTTAKLIRKLLLQRLATAQAAPGQEAAFIRSI